VSNLQRVQIGALILVLLAGFLWSQKLSRSYVQRTIDQLRQTENDQIGMVEERVAANNDAIELVNMGRKFLSAGNPRFAIVPLEKAVEIRSDYRDSWYLLGYSYIQAANELRTDVHKVVQRQELLQKAVVALQKAKSIDPSHEATNDLLAELGVDNSAGSGLGGNE
jgi:tetratricopeptide (TPR) repeat protein